MSVRVMQGDCRTMLATLPDASVQCCVTSPPYANLRDYGHPDQIGAEATAEEYITELVNVFRKVRRVLRDDGTLWLNLGDGMADKQLRMIPARVALALQADGWVLRSDIIWAKPSCMPESVTDRPTSAHEHVFLLTKRAKYFYDADAVKEPTASLDPDHTSYRPNSVAIAGDGRKEFSAKNGASMRSYDPAGRNLRNVWTIATQPFSGAHFATMPPDLAERCVRAGTSERGQCPHCGSPWARVVERGAPYPDMPGRKGTAHDPTSQASRAGSAVSKMSGTEQAAWRAANPNLTTGWSPTCACPEHKPVPQTVLDPFGGAGTTGLVADRLGRNAVLIELNPKYANLARARVVGDAPLFAEVAD